MTLADVIFVLNKGVVESKKARKPSDVVKPGEQVEVMVLGVNQADRRIALGLKQALGDPWAEAPQKFPVGRWWRLRSPA